MAGSKKLTEAPSDPLDAMLARLKLSGIRGQLDSLLDEAKSGLIKSPAGDGPPVGSASLRPVTGGTDLQPKS